MTTGTKTDWEGSLHQSLRILPPADYLEPYLSSEGLSPSEVLARLPFDRARTNDPNKTMPDDKRRRDVRHMCEWTGLAYEDDDDLLRVTELGKAVLRWIRSEGGRPPLINERNALILGVDPTHLRKIEAGSLPAVGVTRLVAIANALGCATLQELFEAPASREPRGPGRPKKKP